MKKALVPALVAAVLMGSAAAVATVLTPSQKIVDRLPKLDLEVAIPGQFGEWKVDTRATGGVVNPQQAEKLNQLYSQILSRTYVNRQGYRVMLSIAYGEDQRDSNQLHYPEVCYPSQGFQVTSNKVGSITTERGLIPVRKLESHLSGQRFEPITYWTTVGDKALLGGTRKKIIEMEYGLKGEIPDGLLFRVSSIDKQSNDAFAVQESFVRELLKSLDPAVRSRISGSEG
ncbi:exosortase-associated protein EpsI, B-type [Methyloversatilis sp.]|uniref:exosortase-associated protein EpsI, B-type n=1 Tax=Methyloversatilis sp. TaxID=2569862 RepID=UPI0035B1FBCE